METAHSSSKNGQLSTNCERLWDYTVMVNLQVPKRSTNQELSHLLCWVQEQSHPWKPHTGHCCGVTVCTPLFQTPWRPRLCRNSGINQTHSLSTLHAEYDQFLLNYFKIRSFLFLVPPDGVLQNPPMCSCAGAIFSMQKQYCEHTPSECKAEYKSCRMAECQMEEQS